MGKDLILHGTGGIVVRLTRTRFGAVIDEMAFEEILNSLLR